jgi:hypothetical protein
MTMKMKTFLCLAALVGFPTIASASAADVDVVSTTVDAATNQNTLPVMTKQTLNMTDIKNKIKRGPTLEEMEEEEEERIKRSKERRDQARKKLASLQPDTSQLERLTKEELDSFLEDEEDHPWIRRAAWRGRSDYSPYSLNMADPSKSYDRWAQGYRMLGGFIDCDHRKQQKNEHNNNNNNNNNQNQQGNGCSRWMMWAAVSTVELSEVSSNEETLD